MPGLTFFTSEAKKLTANLAKFTQLTNILVAYNLLKNIKIQVKKWWPTGLTALVVLYATLWPDPMAADQVMLFPGADKLIHAIMMGGLSSAILFDIRRSGQSLSKKVCKRVGIGMVIFSLADEIGQSAMELGRTFEVLDFLADSGGVILGILLGRPVINCIFRKS